MEDSTNEKLSGGRTTKEKLKYFTLNTKDNLKYVGSISHQFSKDHPYATGMIIATGTIAAIPPVLVLAGFSGTGIVAGSLAAKGMAILGSGSKIIAISQSIGSTGVVVNGTISTLFATTGVAVPLGKFIDVIGKKKPISKL